MTLETHCKKCLILFSTKKEMKNIINLSSAELAKSVVKFKQSTEHVFVQKTDYTKCALLKKSL